MFTQEARTEFKAGRITAEQLLDVMANLETIYRRLLAENERLKQRLAQYEPEVASETPAADSASTSSAAHYSVEAEEKRRDPPQGKKSPGRRTTEEKFSQAAVVEDIYPDGVRREDCQLVRERAVWRLVDGRAVLVGYRVFRAPGVAEPRIPGVTWRCEYGIEILVTLAYLVYVTGISIDKACQLLHFFCQLELSKSQADALLRQLARCWEEEFDTLCDLLVAAAVVYMDETGWKVGQENCSLWTFATKLQRVFLFGCHKDAATLNTILPPDKFTGIGVSDNAAVYGQRFAQGQKCWAHLLRKAIRLSLLYPRRQDYRRFLDELMKLYRDAKRAAADKRLGPNGRKRRVAEFEERLFALCRRYLRVATPGMKPHEREFANLVNEFSDLGLDEELFTFVLNPEVEPTNNSTERLQRSPAKDREAGRTSKNADGAHRRSVIVSVLESLRASLPAFTLRAVIEEVMSWMTEGVSLFDRQWRKVCLDTG